MISFIFSFNPWLRKTLAIFYLAVVAFLSLMPASDLPRIALFQNIDIEVHLTVHFFMYLGLSILVCWSLGVDRNRMAPIYGLLTGAFFYGVLMEILQRTIHNGRQFMFKDMLANLIGASVGLIVYRYLDKLRIAEELKAKEE